MKTLTGIKQKIAGKPIENGKSATVNIVNQIHFMLLKEVRLAFFIDNVYKIK